MSPRHKWAKTEAMHDGESVDRCVRCKTERVRDSATSSLYFYRGGFALAPRGRQLRPEWEAFVSGVIPKCSGGGA